ncbi:unnamed protein product [Psylliodes chrysocephalus]|uniref:Major facilitator superfamily (MFS) profile domain-containing protein n=1 Tax=Psylliodes chrysocephalus TaxID=3402493 RepID=A0A9P0CPJ5_9CUCU|nr:unnamed protein product [Psylliodes chrysocephala]
MEIFKISGEERESQKQNEDTEQSHSPAKFEEAIAATGFGKYNYFLLMAVAVPCINQLLCTVELSYVTPVAQCDLNLTLEDRGALNAITFAGMIASGFLWGYFCDALGRKKIVVYGYLCSGIFGLIAASSMNKTTLITAKFMLGLVMNGPFAATTSQITEFHSTKYRGLVSISRGIFFSIGNLIIPLMSWAILPRHWDFKIFNYFEFHSWNVFLLMCTLSTFLSSLVYTFIPESPKFLMTAGRNDEALRIMQKVFSVNTGKPMEEFPIKALEEEVINNPTKKVTVNKKLKQELKEVVHIFHRPHITNLALVCFNVFTLVMSLNTLKLWLPGIFQSISDYTNVHNGTGASMCIMLGEMIPVNVSSTQECSVDRDNISVYINTFIVAFTRILAFGVSGTFLRLLGVKTMNIICCYISGILMLSIYLAYDELIVTILAAIGTSIGSVGENMLIMLTLEMFPTNLRTIAISIHFTLGRIGTLTGNIVFPYLMHLGCLPPFLFVGVFAMVCATTSFLYSSIENKPLE